MTIRELNRGSSREYAEILAKSMSTKAIADLLSVLVGIEGDDRFTDREARIGGWLFGRLSEICPEAVTIAMSG